MAVRLVPMALLAGVAAGVATVFLHQSGWGLALGLAATVLVTLVTPRGWATRLVFAVGDAAAVGLFSVPRTEGDYLVSADASGYTVLAVTVLVVGYAIATLPRPSRWAPNEPDGHAADPEAFAGRE